MLRNERQNLIYSILTREGSAKACELAAELYTSESSIRRDLVKMESAGIVKRSCGRAYPVGTTNGVVPFSSRSYSAADEKRAIAKKAITLIKEGDVIFLDQSSTSYFLAVELMSFGHVTVLTNNIEILSLLSHTDKTVYCSGGSVSPKNKNCLIGNGASASFSSLYADLAFFSANAISNEGVITDCTEEEIFVRRAMLASAKRRVFLCDSSKVNRVSVWRQCTLSDIDIAVTDGCAFDKFKSSFTNLKVL